MVTMWASGAARTEGMSRLGKKGKKRMLVAPAARDFRRGNSAPSPTKTMPMFSLCNCARGGDEGIPRSVKTQIAGVK